MTTAGAVLGLIRASRPQLTTAVERAAFAVHATFLAAGYCLVATGTKANSSSSGREEEPEVGIEGWDEMEGAYAFRYTGNGQPGLLESVTLKCMMMGDSLMVDAASMDADTPVHVDIKACDYAAEGAAGNYGQQYTNLDGLVSYINTSVLAKLSPEHVKEKTVPAAATRTVQGERFGEGARTPQTGSSLIDETQPSGGPGYAYPPVPAFGGSDLYPSPGAGIFGSRQDPGHGGGMLLGPNDPRWGRMDLSHPGLPGIPGVPPGARFDPYGPPGVPGFEPQRFTRDPRRRPGGHPDLEHFSTDL